VAARLGHHRPAVPLPGGRGWLIVAGSLNPASRAQVRALAEAGGAGLVVDPEQEADVRPLAAHLSRQRPVFVTTAADGPATPEARARVAAALGRTAARVLAQRRPDLVAVSGGDTARALLGALGAARLELVGSPSSGLALGEVLLEGMPAISLLTKAGGFGPPDLFLTLLKGAA
jgi:uncharacterized protein YgbK (DUF1537 family)